MPLLNIFLLIGIGALILSIFTQRKSAIWGGATIGLIVGVILGVLKGDFSDILRAALIGADVGLLAEILELFGGRLKRKS